MPLTTLAIVVVTAVRPVAGAIPLVIDLTVAGEVTTHRCIDMHGCNDWLLLAEEFDTRMGARDPVRIRM